MFTQLPDGQQINEKNTAEAHFTIEKKHVYWLLGFSIFVTILLLILLISFWVFRKSQNNFVAITQSSSSSSLAYQYDFESSANTEETFGSTSSVESSSQGQSSESSSSSSQGLKFLHNEGKYVRFDYPEGWNLEVTSNKSDKSFSSFDDINEIILTKDGYTMKVTDLLPRGGVGYMIDSINNQFLVSRIEESLKKYPIKDLEVSQMNLNDRYFIEFTFAQDVEGIDNVYNGESIYNGRRIQIMATSNQGSICNGTSQNCFSLDPDFGYAKPDNVNTIAFIPLSSNLASSSWDRAVVLDRKNDSNFMKGDDLVVIIEKFVNSIQKK
ncbi:hypothetical protein IPJ91_00190 [bacterium]|nr:MAG: hypothetical protein IPJ91_00190 [bacterium]